MLKKRLNTLNIIKNSEIKHKRLIPGQKELLNLFNDLSDIILTDKISERQENENEKVESRKEENEKVESKKEENKDEDYENWYENEDDDDETMSQNEKNKITEGLNNNLNEIIDKSKSFEEQIKSL